MEVRGQCGSNGEETCWRSGVEAESGQFGFKAQLNNIVDIIRVPRVFGIYWYYFGLLNHRHRGVRCR
jgi:hypothetical protein